MRLDGHARSCNRLLTRAVSPSVAKRKTLFDDRPVEISELTYIIKQDIAQLNQQIAQLQSFVKANAIGAGAGSKSGPGGKQVEEHNANVVMMLQSKLADTSLGFKDVLEIRTQVGGARHDVQSSQADAIRSTRSLPQNMKASRDRTEQFQFANPSAPSGPSSGTFAILLLSVIIGVSGL